MNDSEDSLCPYVIGNAVGNSPAFVGREEVLQEVRNVLKHSQQNAIVLYGQRRIGKTSILKELEAKLVQEGYLPVFFDLQDKGTFSLEQVNQELANKISDKLNSQSQPALENLLSQWESPEKLVILFDEFEAFAGNEFEEQQASETFFPYWREILSKVDKAKLNFVFTLGRKVEDLNQKAMSLLKAIPSKKVSLLDHDATVRLIKLSDSEANQTLKWDERAIKAVWTQTAGHPFITQILCYCIWNHLYEAEQPSKPRVSKTEVNASLPKALETGENAFQWLWDGLPATEKLVTSILASTGPVTAQALEQLLKDNGLRIGNEDQQKATDVLKEWDVIRQVAEDEFSFRVELFRCWIAKNKTLRKVEQELDSSESKANYFYERGKKSLALNQLAEAIADFEMAVKLNPSHINANGSLTQAYLSLQKWDKAWQTAKAWSLLRPQSARSFLTRALEELIAGQDEDTQLRYYEETLEIDPEHADIKQQWQKILQQRGDKAYQAGKLDEALEAYKKAGLGDQVALVEGDMAYQSGDFKKALEYYKHAKSNDKIAEIEGLQMAQREIGSYLDDLVEQSKGIDTVLLYDIKRNKLYHNQNSVESQKSLLALKIVFQNLLLKVDNFGKITNSGQFQYAIFPFVNKGAFHVYFVDELSCMIGFVSSVNMGRAISEGGKLLKRLMESKEQVSIFFS